MSVRPYKNTVPQHASSPLLYDEENKILHELIGSKAQCLSMAVVQLFFTRKPTFTQWIKESAGVLTLIKDDVRRAFTLKVFNMDSQYYTVIFEEYLNEYMEYREDTEFFHTFHLEDRIVAFNFADHCEASTIIVKIQERLQWLQNRSQNQRIPRPSVMSTTVTEPDTNYKKQNAKDKNSSGFDVITSKKRGIKKKGNEAKKTLKKSDIGAPTNFTHTLHYGINMETNFSLEECPSDLRSLLKDAKVTNTQLKDPQVREVIRNTLEQHRMSDMNMNQTNFDNAQKEIEPQEDYGGRHKPEKDLSRSSILRTYYQEYDSNQMQDTTVPQERDVIRRMPSTGDVGVQIAVDQRELVSAINNRRRSKETRDDTPTRNVGVSSLPKRQPTIRKENRPLVIPQRKDSKLTVRRPQAKEPLTLPSVMTERALPPIPVQSKNEVKKTASGGSKHIAPRAPPPATPIKGSSKSSSAPPAPPPPPIANAPPPPPLPSMVLDSDDVDTSTDGRVTLLNDIRKGTTLKPPDLNKMKASSTGLGTPRNDLLQDIRMGKQLKPVQARNPEINGKDEDALNTHGNDLAAALNKALKIRQIAIQYDDDSNDELEESDDEWDA